MGVGQIIGIILGCLAGLTVCFGHFIYLFIRKRIERKKIDNLCPRFKENEVVKEFVSEILKKLDEKNLELLNSNENYYRFASRVIISQDKIKLNIEKCVYQESFHAKEMENLTLLERYAMSKAIKALLEEQRKNVFADTSRWNRNSSRFYVNLTYRNPNYVEPKKVEYKKW